MRADIDTELLRAFVAVVEQGGFTRAARRIIDLNDGRLPLAVVRLADHLAAALRER